MPCSSGLDRRSTSRTSPCAGPTSTTAGWRSPLSSTDSASGWATPSWCITREGEAMMRNAARLLGAGLALASVMTVAWAPVRPQAEDLTVRVTQVDRSRFPQVTGYVSATDAAGAPVPFSADGGRIGGGG